MSAVVIYQDNERRLLCEDKTLYAEVVSHLDRSDAPVWKDATRNEELETLKLAVLALHTRYCSADRPESAAEQREREREEIEEGEILRRARESRR